MVLGFLVPHIDVFLRESAQIKEVEIDPDQQREREADKAATQAVSGEDPLLVNRLGTDIHIQRVAKLEALETLAMLELENEESADLNEFREEQNTHRIEYLREALTEHQAEFTDVVAEDDERSGVSERLDLKTLDNKLADKLQDVGLTDDQRQKLERGIDTGDWVDFGTPAASSLVGQLLTPLAGLATGIGLVGLKKWFGSLDGEIEARMEKLTIELEERGYLTGDGARPDSVPTSGEVNP
ncbi:transposase [Natrialba hulunbeirensis JCM 10989]|uniref:Transposase n=1 Tax=Natrialba hulunbeirensis JCM 10989 TaxID=1227493 RepID=M0AB81_9EURY|nr:hypothetical protein [Natrialba hulunbeirensis]ELY95661.1 transposase [Natrialba hulunbeirensis JCM 10989]